MRILVLLVLVGSVTGGRASEPAPPPRPVAPRVEVAPPPREVPGVPDEPPPTNSGLDASVLPPTVPPPVEIRLTDRGVEIGPEKRDSQPKPTPPTPANFPNPQREKAERELPWMIGFGGFMVLVLLARAVFGRSKPPAAGL